MITPIAQPVFERIVKLRREIHRNPELAFEEVETAGVIMRELNELGIPFEYMGKGGGVVGRLTNGNPASPVVALRAEMDALPGTEATNLSFSASNGKVHACGHDAHMAMVLGAARLLAQDPPKGDVLFIFQPAEERGGGARVMVESGLLGEVRAIFAGHVTHLYQVGEIMVGHGIVTAQSDRFWIRVHGKGGHGARPHEAVDAVAIAALLINALQMVVSRQVNPIYPTVITIGRVEAGTAPNIIAQEALLEGTIRTTLPATRAQIRQGLLRMCKALGEMHNARIEMAMIDGYPPVINSQREADIAARAAAKVIGQEKIMPLEHPSMGSEDFSFFLQKIPGAYVRFGARLSDREYIALHNPAFDIDERVLGVGAAYFDQVVRLASHEYSQVP